MRESSTSDNKAVADINAGSRSATRAKRAKQRGAHAATSTAQSRRLHLINARSMGMWLKAVDTEQNPTPPDLKTGTVVMVQASMHLEYTADLGAVYVCLSGHAVTTEGVSLPTLLRIPVELDDDQAFRLKNLQSDRTLGNPFTAVIK